MEKLNEMSAKLTELSERLDKATQFDFMEATVEVDNVKSMIEMARTFVYYLDDFPRKNEIESGFKAMLSVLCVLEIRINDTLNKLCRINRELKQVL